MHNFVTAGAEATLRLRGEQEPQVLLKQNLTLVLTEERWSFWAKQILPSATRLS
jgi:hypothetical protein